MGYYLQQLSHWRTEVVAVTAGESPNPKETMPKAVKQVFWRILIFYIATMLIISSIVSANDPRLLDTKNVTASPLQLSFKILDWK